MPVITYTLLTAADASSLANLVTGSMQQGYIPVGAAEASGSGFIQTMMLQYANDVHENPERLSRAYRNNTTASAFYTTSSNYL